MDAEKKKVWVDALRGGQYKQGRKHLRHDDEYCCLGVLCDLVHDFGKWGKPDRLGIYCYETKDFGRASMTLPTPLRVSCGISVEDMNHLIDMNDDGRKSFDEIANYIEEHL
jgi:hypothetical protein